MPNRRLCQYVTCKHDQKFARIYVSEMAALLEVLDEGDASLHYRAQRASRLALDWADEGLDFADALHLASSLAVGRFATFDAKLRNRVTPLQGLDIEEP